MRETGYLTSASRDATYKRLLETTLFVIDVSLTPRIRALYTYTKYTYTEADLVHQSGDDRLDARHQSRLAERRASPTPACAGAVQDSQWERQGENLQP